MKGKDLIIYILNNNMEDVDFPIYTNDGWSDYISAEDAAKKFHLKEETIIKLIKSGTITGTLLNGVYYIPKTTSLNIKNEAIFSRGFFNKMKQNGGK